MKLTDNQKSKIEDSFRRHAINDGFTVTSLNVTDSFIKYQLSIPFNNIEKYHKSYEYSRYETVLSIENRLDIEIRYKLNEKSTLSDVENEILKSDVFKMFSNNVKFKSVSFENAIKEVLAKKPYADVNSYLRNITGEIQIEISDLSQRVFDVLKEYYQSDEYLEEKRQKEIDESKLPRSIQIVFKEDFLEDDELLDLEHYADGSEVLRKFITYVIDNFTKSIENDGYKVELDDVSISTDNSEIWFDLSIKEPITYEEAKQLISEHCPTRFTFYFQKDVGYYERRIEEIEAIYYIDSSMIIT